MSNSTEFTRRSTVLIALSALLMCGVVAAISYFIGLQTAVLAAPATAVTEREVTREVIVRESIAAEPEVLTEIQEVTREVIITEPAPDATPEAPAAGAVAAEVDLSVLREVWAILNEQFDGDVPADSALFYSAIDGTLSALDDDFTVYLPPDVAERERTNSSGSFEGIGAFVRANDDGLAEIVRPIDGQPADLAGLRAGDIIVAVDGDSVLNLGLDETISLIRGPRGTEVTLTVRREGGPDFDVTIVRARIELETVEARLIDDNVAYIRLTEFNRVAFDQVLLALNELTSQGAESLVFDLRDNGGGFLDQALFVTDLYLESGVILRQRNNRGLDDVSQARSGDAGEDIPMVVLVNAGSASASEVLAGALQDNGRAIVIGETTFGKGSVQRLNTLSDGSELRVTIARWYTPSNQSIDGQGITPDIVVATPEDLGGEDDSQLQRAVDFLQNGE